MARSDVVSSARCFSYDDETPTDVTPTQRAYIQSSRRTNGTGKVAHLRMIKDKIREDDQVEGCMRVSRVCGSDVRRQRSEERLDGLSPHVPKHARGAAAPRLGVLRVRVKILRDVERQIVDEGLVRVIREDDLHTIYIQNDIIGGGIFSHQV